MGISESNHELNNGNSSQLSFAVPENKNKDTAIDLFDSVNYW